MTTPVQFPAQTDYEDWLRQGNAEALWSVGNPELIRQAFIAGWRAGVIHVAARVWYTMACDPMTETMLADVVASEDTDKPPGG